MSERYERGPARAAAGEFPYNHGSIAEQDAKAEARKARALYGQECRRIQRKVFG